VKTVLSVCRDREIPDPAGLEPAAFDEVRDEIERKVTALVEEIGK